MRLVALTTAGFIMASQAEIQNMVERMLALQPYRNLRVEPPRVTPNAPRMVPRAPDLQVESDEIIAERARRNPPLSPWWYEQQREYNRRLAPYDNPNLKGPYQGEEPADATPYEDPWTGPTLAPRRRK